MKDDARTMKNLQKKPEYGKKANSQFTYLLKIKCEYAS